MQHSLQQGIPQQHMQQVTQQQHIAHMAQQNPQVNYYYCGDHSIQLLENNINKYW